MRGRKRAREEIEYWVLSRYDMKKRSPDGSEYELTIPYHTDEELDRTIYEILDEAQRIADDRHCFTESDIRSVDDEQRSW